MGQANTVQHTIIIFATMFDLRWMGYVDRLCGKLERNEGEAAFIICMFHGFLKLHSYICVRKDAKYFARSVTVKRKKKEREKYLINF